MIDVVRSEGSSGAAFCFLIVILFLILIGLFVCQCAERTKVKSKIKIKKQTAHAWAFFRDAGWALALIGLTLLSACTKPAGNNAAAAVTNRWSWESYPVVEKMRLGILPCRVLPKASSSINSPLTGLLRIYVDKQQTNVPAGFVWAEFEPKLLAASSNALAEAEEKLNEREKLLLQLELPKQQIKLGKEIEEAKRQLALMEILRTNQEAAVAAFAQTGLRERSLTPETFQRAQQELKLMQTNYAYLQATNLQVLGVDIQTPRTELERRRLEFEHQENQSRFKIPFSCQLNISFPLADGVFEYPINSGQEIAVLRDLSSILLRVILSDASWSGLPAENLTSIINMNDGRRLEAPFGFKRIEKIQQREDVIYYFEFPTNSINAAARLIGTDLSCEMWLKLPERARVIPKLTLVLNNPQSAFPNRRWNEAVAQLVPGARVLVEGQTDLAIVFPEKNHEAKEKE
jgi:hypothetical protein